MKTATLIDHAGQSREMQVNRWFKTIFIPSLFQGYPPYKEFRHAGRGVYYEWGSQHGVLKGTR